MWARSPQGAGTVGRGASAQRSIRAPLLVLGAVALVGGLWGALARLGVPVGAPDTVWESHGILMTMGFLGTVIALERAVAIGRRAAYISPGLAGVGTLALLIGAPEALWIFVAASASFAAVCAYMWRLRPEVPTAAMALGGAAWLVAAIALALATPIGRVVPLLAAFVVLTVAGERVGLSRIARPPRWSTVPFAIACGLVLAGAALSLARADAVAIAGAGLLVLAAWLTAWDLAWRNVRRTGVTRYMAVALVAGYAWLALGGVTWVVRPGGASIFAYDALIHTVFVGFVLSLIFAHELMIVPALLGIAIPFSLALYVPLALLHASLAVRIAGDILGDARTWQWAGTLNVVSVLLFAAVSVASARGLFARPT